MIPTTIDGQSVMLLTAPPTRGVVKVEFEQLATTSTGLSQRETRRGLGQSLRIAAMEYTSAGRGPAIRGGLRALTNQPVVVPFWPGAVLWATRASMPIQGGLMIVWREGWTQWQIYTTTEPGWATSTDYVAPLVWGFLDSPELEPLTPNAQSWDIRFIENSPIAYALQVVVGSGATSGPQPAGWPEPPPVLPYGTAWRRPRSRLTVEVEREQLGYGRQRAETFYPQPVVREEELDLALTGQDPARLLAFFRWVSVGTAFWAHGEAAVARLAAPATAGAGSITVDDTAALAVGDWLVFRRPGERLGHAQISGLSGNVVSLTGGTPAALDPTDTVIGHMLLVRLQRPRLTITWRGDRVANARLSVREVPAEVTPAGDEQVGSTLSRLPIRLYLYEFRRRLDGVDYYQRYTSHEDTVLALGQEWAPLKISHGAITQSLRLDRDEVEVTLDLAAGLWITDLARGQSEAPVYVRIWQGEVGGGVVEVDTLAIALLAQEASVPAVQVDTMGVTVIGLESVQNIELNTLAAAVLGQETLVQAVDVNTLGLAVVGQDTLPPTVELNTLGVAVISQETLGQAVELNTLSILVIAQTPL